MTLAILGTASGRFVGVGRYRSGLVRFILLYQATKKPTSATIASTTLRLGFVDKPKGMNVSLVDISRLRR